MKVWRKVTNTSFWRLFLILILNKINIIVWKTIHLKSIIIKREQKQKIQRFEPSFLRMFNTQLNTGKTRKLQTAMHKCAAKAMGENQE